MNAALAAYCLINTVFIVFLSPLFMGIVKKTKAKMQGRKGSSIFQPYYNLLKLLKKEAVYSDNSSWISRAAPYINMIVLVAASLFVPLVFVPGTSFMVGGIIVFVYLLALAKFFMVLAGMDAGTTFGGMGSSREMSISSLTEPVLFLIIAGLTLIVNSTDTFKLFSASVSAQGILNIQPISIMLVVSLLLILFVETSRIPIDNPETHLELTMIHEGMLLEQSGKNLAMMEWSHAIKQMSLMGLIVGIALPFGIASSFSAGAIGIGAAAALLKISLFAVLIGSIESLLAKVRLFRIPTILATAFFLSFITIIMEVFL